MYNGVFKEHSGILDKIGQNRQWAASSLADGMNATVNGSYQTAEAFWNEDGTGYQRAGSVISALGTMGMSVGLATAYGFAAHGGALFSGNSYRRFLGKVSSKAMSLVGKTGKEFTELESLSVGKNIFVQNIKGGRFSNLADYMHHGQLGDTIGAKTFAQSEIEAMGARSGVWRFATKAGESSGYFVKNSRLMSGVGGAVAIGAMILGSMALDKATGLAGKLMDEAHLAYTQSKFHTYDLREFNNRSAMNWNYNKQNQAATNLMPFEQNNISLARLYYSR